MEVRVESRPDPAVVWALEESVLSETIRMAGVGSDAELAVFAYLEGTLVGGCYGSTWGGTCDLQSLWVRPDRRRQGLGGRLLAAAEDEARSRSCGQVVLFTHQLQVGDFYERRGYAVVGTVDDFPAGSRALWYRKSLRAGRSPA